MSCLRCELARAKVWAALYYNTCRTPAELVNKLNASQEGIYYMVSNNVGTVVRRVNNVIGSPAIDIWFFKS